MSSEQYSGTADSLGPPTYAQVLSTSPDPLARTFGLEAPISPRTTTSLAVRRHRPLRGNSGGRSWSIFYDDAATDLQLAREEEEQADLLFHASIERGNAAQARRRRLLSRPRGRANGQANNAEQLLDELGEELNRASAHSLNEQMTYGSGEGTGEGLDRAPSSSPDPLALPRLPPDRSSRWGFQASLQPHESIFFPPSPERALAPHSASSLLASQLNRPPAPTGSRVYASGEVFVPRIRTTAPKPVFLLYCGASDPTGTCNSQQSLPRDFYYLDAMDSVRRDSYGCRSTVQVLNTWPEGGCGRLLCARASKSANPDLYESDLPPISEAVDWLEEISSRIESVPNASDLSTWPDCSCIRASLGCRACGNVIGQSTIVTCKRCMRFSSCTKWSFYSQSITSRNRRAHERPAATLAASTSLDGKVVYWKATPETSGIPARYEDINDGLAGEASRWQASAEERFEVSPCTARPNLQVKEEEEFWPEPLPLSRFGRTRSTLFTPPHESEPGTERDVIRAGRLDRLERVLAEERSRATGHGSRDASTTDSTAVEEDPVERLLRESQSSDTPRDPSHFDRLIQEAFRLEAARSARPGDGLGEANQARSMRREVRENVNRQAQGASLRRRRDSSPLREGNEATLSDSSSRAVRRRLTVLLGEVPGPGELVGR